MRGMNDLMRQAQVMQRKMAKVQEEAAEKTVEASAGGGMVTAVVNGAHELVSLTIDPQAVDPEDVEMLQDLIKAAVNEGQRQAKEMMEAAMQEITGGINIPGMF